MGGSFLFSLLGALSALFLQALPRRLPAVARMTETLQILRVCELLPVPVKGFNMVYVGRSGSDSAFRAFPAKRFP